MKMDVKEQGKPQIQAVIDVLLENVADKNAVVSESISTSLRKIAKTYTNDVLNVCCEFCKTHDKITKEHLLEILKTMEWICRDYILEIDGDTVITLVEFCVKTMTQNIAYEPLVQLAASGILVALGSKHCVQVVDTLQSKLEKNTIPHYAIPYTLGSLASSSSFGIVPYIKNILEVLVPMMNYIKTDHHKDSVAYALGRFSEAITEYMCNISTAPDPTITASQFYVELGIAYDVLSGIWLFSKDTKIAQTVLNSISSILPNLSSDKINQQTTKIIPVLLNLYKKHKDPLPVTQCLGSYIQVAALANGTLLEPLLPSTLHNISDFICISPDYAQPELLRNHSEVLRCYERLTVHFTDHCLDYLLAHLHNNNEKERVKALLILTHLTNSSENVIQNKIKEFLQTLLELTVDNSLRVKKVLLRTIVAFAYKGLLQKGHEQKYLEFILKLCCKQAPNRYNQFTQQELCDLQTTADNTLYMLSTSVIELEDVLWNLLITCFLSLEYSESCITILRCLTHLAARKFSSETCVAAFVRCIALLAHPVTEFRGNFILNFWKNINLYQSASYKSVWEAKIAHLVKYLEQNYDNFQYKHWECLIYDFLDLSLQNINDDVFNENLILEAKKQLPLYSTKPLEKCLLLKCMAIISCHIKSDIIVIDVLNVIIEMIKFNDGSELSQCAEAIGICSRAHLKLVLEKFNTIRKEVLGKKSLKLSFSFMSNQRHEIELDRIRQMVLASYSQICNEAPSDVLLQVVQYEILDFAVNELKSCKDFTVRQYCLKVIGSVADALHPNRNTLHIHMQDRDIILPLVTGQLLLHSGPDYIELFPIILPVIMSLIRLPPALEEEQRSTLLKHCFDNIYNASAIYCKINADCTPGSGTYYGDLKLAPFVYSSFTKLNFVVQEVLMQSLSPSTLDEIVSLLEPWLGRKKAEQRLPALETLRDALQSYLDNVKFGYEAPTSFTQSGFLLARVVPRCTDPNRAIRKVAVETLRLILCITARYEGHVRDYDQIIKQSLVRIQEEIDSSKPKVLFNLTTDLSNVIVEHLPSMQLPHFISHLIDALLDVESLSSSGSTVVLSAVIKSKGDDLSMNVSDLLNKLLSILDQITCVRTRASALRVVLNFALHHSKVVVAILMVHPLPFTQYLNDCWVVLSTDVELVCDILDQFTKIFKTSNLYEDQSSVNHLRIVTIQPLQALSAMNQIFTNSQLDGICKKKFPELFSILYITLASYIGTAVPATTTRTTNKKEKYSIIPNREAYKLNPLTICMSTLCTFLGCAGYTSVSESLVGYNLENIQQFLDMVPILTENLSMTLSENFTWVVSCIAPYLKSEVEYQRMAAVTFLASSIKFAPQNDHVLLESIIEMLLSVQNDSSYMVRQNMLRGLGYVAEYLSSELVLRYADSFFTNFMQGLDYNTVSNESGVTLDSMLGLSKLLKIPEVNCLYSEQVKAAMRIKPLFEQDDEQLREAAIYLFGNLGSSINDTMQSSEAFREQVCGNLIALLLHLCDEQPCVVKACKYSLRKVAPFLKSTEGNKMVQDHILEEANLHFSDFITDFVKTMGKELPDFFPMFLMTSVSYFKSAWVDIRGSAALLAGMLYSQITDADVRKQVSLGTVCHRLLQLLKDENPQVRMKAVQAIACLYDK